MIVAVASDHAGFPLKETVIETLRAAGHQPLDLGPSSAAPVDYPDFTEKVGKAILSGQAARGVMVCGSGVGACIAANKMKGIYAGVCHDTYSAHQGVEHDDMNVLCLGARIIGPSLAEEIVTAFVAARFTAEERHNRRLEKVRRIERGEAPGRLE